MCEKQLDLFSSAGIHADRPAPPSIELRPAATALDDQALIGAIPNSNLADSIALAAEAGRRRLAAAVPSLETLCRRFSGFGIDRLVPEQVAALQALGAIGGREAAQAVARKLIKGKKRHILVDMQGLLLHAIVHSAGVQDRDGGIWLLATLFGQFPFLAKPFADSAYAGSIFHTALTKVLPCLETAIVKRSDRAKGFVPLPKRWIVIDCTMLPSRALIGHRSSNAGAAGGNRYSFW